MEDIQQGNDGRWYRKIGPGQFEEVAAPDRSSGGGLAGLITGERQPGPGRAGKEQIARGVAGFAGSILDAGQYVGRKTDQLIQGGLGLVGMQGEPLPEQAGPSYNERFVNALGIGPPTSFAGQVAERIGASLPMTLMSGGAAPAGQALNAIRTNLIQDVAGSVASQYAQNRGAGPIGQAVAGILGAVLVPTRNPFGARAGTAAAAREQAIESVSTSPGATQPVVRQLSDSETLRLAKEMKMKPDNVRAVAQYLRDRIAIDPVTGQPKVEEFLATLDEADRLFGAGQKPPLGNVVGDVGGQNILGVQKAVIDENAIANSRATGIQQAIVKDLNERWDRLIPRWDTDSALAQHATLEESRRLAKSAAWDAVPFDQIPTRSSAPIKGVLESIKKTRPLMYAKMPSTTRQFIEGLGDEVSLRDLQDLRADLGNVIEAGRAFGVDPEIRTIGEVSARILGTVKSEIAELPTSGTSAYNAAVKATSDYYDLFDTEFKTTRAFTQYEDKESIVKEVFKANNPSDEIDNLRRVFGQTPDGMDKIQSIFMRDLIGDNLGDKPIVTILRELGKERKSDFYRKLLGPDKYRATMDILKGYRIGTAYQIGSASANLATGSKADSIKRAASIISSPLQSIKGIPSTIAENISKVDAAERAKLIEEMVFDPTGIARKLAKIPAVDASPNEVNGWLSSFAVLRARAQARQSVATQAMSIEQPIGAALDAQGRMIGGAQAAMRQGVSSAVVNQGGVR